MFSRKLLLSCLLVASAYSQDTSTISGTQSISTVTTSDPALETFTGTYATYPTVQTTYSQTSDLVNQNPSYTSSSNASISSTTTSRGYTSVVSVLQGGGLGIETLSIINGTTTIYPSTTASRSSSSTSSASTPVNTQLCNGYTEFCNRKYSNITYVCAHNSAFDVDSNAASNQALGITTQLNDGIRMIQGETHWVNDTVYMCHSSCDLLDVGPWQNELEEMVEWLKANPYDVLTLLIVNSDYTDVTNYVSAIQNSGIEPYLYVPPKNPMHLDDWPTLSELILTGKRVITFMDYDANQTAVPYIMDEFNQMWETPFSPTNQSFPCDVQRPPTLTNMTAARDNFMYLANHNLNVDVAIAGANILIPNTAELNLTNAADVSFGTLGQMAETCYNDWGRAPNFLLVDYYNVGSGSVFEVAAKYNGVNYTGTCCGVGDSRNSKAASLRNSGATAALLMAIIAGVSLMW